jgi:hypothetical protein
MARTSDPDSSDVTVFVMSDAGRRILVPTVDETCPMSPSVLLHYCFFADYEDDCTSAEAGTVAGDMRSGAHIHSGAPCGFQWWHQPRS